MDDASIDMSSLVPMSFSTNNRNLDGRSSSYPSYVNSNDYIHINSGKDSRVRVNNSIHPLNEEECQVYKSLLDESDGSTITPSLNHHVSRDGLVQGFRFTCNGGEPSSRIPINRQMFFRYSMAECTSATGWDERSILRLMMNRGDAMGRLLGIVDGLKRSSDGNEIDFDCMSDSMDSYSRGDPVGSYSHHYRVASDCKPWSPEVPRMIGLYHAFVKGFNRDTRVHKLFIVVDGGCTRLCDRFYNLSLDIGHKMDCKQLIQSEEVRFIPRDHKQNQIVCKINIRVDKRSFIYLFLTIVSKPIPSLECRYRSHRLGHTRTHHHKSPPNVELPIAGMVYKQGMPEEQCKDTLQCCKGVWYTSTIHKGPLCTRWIY